MVKFCKHAVHTLAILVIAVITFLSMTEQADACSCMPAHPQQSYCRAEYVIFARILHRKMNHMKQVVYKIDVRKVYKMSEMAERSLQKRKLITAAHEMTCGINLKVGKLYLISGYNHHINMCQNIKEYSTLTSVEKRGLASGYKHGCNCDIIPVFGNYLHRDYDKACTFAPFDSCEYTHGVCFPKRSQYNESEPHCYWRQTLAYKKCRDAEP